MVDRLLICIIMYYSYGIRNVYCNSIYEKQSICMCVYSNTVTALCILQDFGSKSSSHALAT